MVSDRRNSCLVHAGGICHVMQAGFAMVETGFTRAKNAANIIMKNLMDFCLGTVVFVLLGAGLLMGEDALFGLIGVPNVDFITNFATYDWSNFFFNLVFCATTATIVSGANTGLSVPMRILRPFPWRRKCLIRKG